MRTVTILLLLAALIVIGALATRTPEAPSGPGTTRAPQTAVATPAAATVPVMSTELRDYCQEPYTHLRISPAQDIHAYTRYQMTTQAKFGRLGLRYVVDPDVRGTLEVDARDVTWASVLDDFCRRNSCRWEVADPRTIRIRTIPPQLSSDRPQP